MNAAQILAIPKDQPGRLYGIDGAEPKATFRLLAKQWHPDHGGDAAVFAHVKTLYEAAIHQQAAGLLVGGNKVDLTSEAGKQYVMAGIQTSHTVETGEYYVNRGFVLHTFTHANADLFTRAVATNRKWFYPNAKMEGEIKSFLPEYAESFSTTDRKVLVVRKAPGLLCLRDVLNHFGGKLPAVHVAWIVSRMYHLGCYLQMLAKLVHTDISLDTVFVNPAEHRLALLGGWGYSYPLGARIVALPGYTQALGVAGGVPATHAATATLIRALGLTLLGGVAGGSNLLADKSIPRPLLLWLRGVGTDKALDEYEAWQKVLTASFGPRKFHVLNCTTEDLYGKV